MIMVHCHFTSAVPTTMEESPITPNLNEAQLAAVTAPTEHVLVLAGAGSGKTRVLAQRIDWLVEHQDISPQRIFAVTFTNKAALEMRSRVETALHMPMNTLWIGTFHGMAHRLLRRHWQEAKLPQTFQVIDSDDQQRIIRRILKQLQLDEAKWPAKQAQWFINTQKERALRPHHSDTDDDLFTTTYRRVYAAYEETCRNGGLVDFAELLLRSYELWLECPEVLQHYQERFQHILVDEFQDTNQLQYQWLKLLAGQHAKLFVVGDDDQSIYSWRGAQIEHLTRFVRDFPGAITIRLEQNYRSTAVILNAANAVIAHNRNRMGKNLWTQGQQGEPIAIYEALNDRDEARFIVQHIQEWVAQGHARNDVAILYRSNAQSRVLEEALLQAHVSYRIYGGLRFFERAEIKDALAYLRLVANHNDDAAFDRIINLPARGIGDTTLATLRNNAREYSVSLWSAAQTASTDGTLNTRAAGAISAFLQLIASLRAATQTLGLAEQTAYILNHSGLMDALRQDQSERGRSRLENLEELISAAYEYRPDPEDTGINPLLSFLAHAALESGEHQAEHEQDCVHLMTLHAAKGLEFALVFISGMEEGLFPHSLASQDPKQLEEERRLCYVGMTRAMAKLCLSHAQTRYLHGREMRQIPSRFLREIPEHLCSSALLRIKITQPTYTQRNATRLSTPAIQSLLGRRVKHKQFGEGIVLDQEGSGEQARLQVRFSSGVKWLVASYAKLELI